MSYEIVLKGAVVVDPQNHIHGKMDLALEDGKIALAAEEISGGKQVIDVSGKVLIPGGIDPHVHCDATLTTGFYMVAKTGITTIVDFAGPPQEVVDSVAAGKGCGLNVATLETVRPDPQEGIDLTRGTIDRQLDRALAEGALGLKLLGGHFPLSPEASERAVDAACERKVVMAIHSGSTAHGSDILGMRESVYDFVHGRPAVLAHINAYCRGRVRPYLQELEEAFTMLRENRNIVSDAHMALPNGTHGRCKGEELEDFITMNCLKTFGYPATRSGLRAAIQDRVARVMKETPLETLLVEGPEALEYWEATETRAMVSFPVNLAATACACLLERLTPGGEFLIGMAATDGGGIPRNDLIGRLLSFYRLGYLSLEDIVSKICTTPAKVFGFTGKGHLGAGADADISVLDLSAGRAVMSFAMGQMIMRDGQSIGTGGHMLVPREGAETMARKGCAYSIVDVARNSILYR